MRAVIVCANVDETIRRFTRCQPAFGPPVGTRFELAAVAGPERNGVSKASGLPLEWGERILWKIPVEGRGHSSPIVWGDRVFVTSDIEGDVIPGKKAPHHLRAGETYSHPAAQSADRRHTLKVLSLDAHTGEILWARTAHDGPVFDNRHRRNTYATPTAVTDGILVYVYFGSQGLFAYDFDGSSRGRSTSGTSVLGATVTERPRCSTATL